MRTIAVALACFTGFVTTLAGAIPVDVQGLARIGKQAATNAVVWLESPDQALPPPTKRIVLDQRNLTFYPHVLAIRVGTTVEFPNNDRVFHNVFSFRDGKRFDLGMYPVGTMRPVKFDKPGVSRIFCNIHSNMAAYIVAVDTPYFAVSDKSGAFVIPDVPAGSYKLGAWRAGGEVLAGTFMTEAEKPLEVLWQ